MYLYLLTLDGRLYAVHPLPGPGSESRPAGEAAWTRAIKSSMDAAMRTVTQMRQIDFDVNVRVQVTFHALDFLAHELSRVPGRKNIVWITDGVPIELGPNRSDTGDFVDFTPYLRELCEGFDRSGVSIYPVRQVMLGSPSNIDGPPSSNAAIPGMGSIATLTQFAELTGGRPDAGKDIGVALRQAIHDARTSYQIGYYPPEKNWDDKYHKLRFTCTRKGVRLQSKIGYYAWRTPPGSRSEEAINSAMPATFDTAEIGMRASLSPDPAGGRNMRLKAYFDLQDVTLVQVGGLFQGAVTLAVAAYAPGVQPKHGPIVPLDLHYSAQDVERAAQGGIEFSQAISIPEEVTAIRLIVFDRGSNAVGSVTLPVPAKHSRPE